jgi:hypothetical protein
LAFCAQQSRSLTPTKNPPATSTAYAQLFFQLAQEIIVNIMGRQWLMLGRLDPASPDLASGHDVIARCQYFDFTAKAREIKKTDPGTFFGCCSFFSFSFWRVLFIRRHSCSPV